jgi:hypothetical protein
MGLSRRLTRLEVLARGDQEQAPTFWAPERIEQQAQWLVRLLETMPERRAVVAYVELTTLPAEQWAPLTRHVDRMAVLLADGIHGAPGGGERPYGFPEPVCAVLEVHPDVDIRSAHDCEDCGFQTPVQRQRGPGYGQPFLTVCPLCGGAVRWQGFNHARWSTLWQQQRAEMAGGGSTGVVI